MNPDDELDQAVALANGRAPGRRPSAAGHPGGEAVAPAPAPTRSRHAGAVPWAEARARAARAGRPLAEVTLPLGEALQHILAAPLRALTDLPPFDTSAMDGWAVSGPGPWVTAAAHAGGDPHGSGILAGDRQDPLRLDDGEAVRIATGARIPPGAGAVIRSEHAEVHGGRVRTPHAPQPGADIRPRGQECRSGDELLPAGHRVTPAVLGLAAAAGHDRLTVLRRPRVEVLVLGDELLHTGLPRDGRIRDALGPMVAPWLAALGADVLVTRRLGDDAEALREAVASTTADLVVTTGGTASGPVDHVHPTLHALGARLVLDGVQVRPGHPMLLAELDGGAHLVGLPGNPLAALSGLMTLAAPLLRALRNCPAEEELYVPLSEGANGHPRDTRIVPVTYSPAESLARPLHYNGPAMLRGIATASALAVVPPGGIAAGAGVRLLALPW